MSPARLRLIGLIVIGAALLLLAVWLSGSLSPPIPNAPLSNAMQQR
jgi:hypothetical protein